MKNKEKEIAKLYKQIEFLDDLFASTRACLDHVICQMEKIYAQSKKKEKAKRGD